MSRIMARWITKMIGGSVVTGALVLFLWSYSNEGKRPIELPPVLAGVMYGTLMNAILDYKGKQDE